MQKNKSKVLFSGEDNSFYRMMNNLQMNWRKLLLSFAKRFITHIQTHGGKNNNVKCFIIDDTLIEKTGKTIRFIGKVFDHVRKS